MSKDYEPNGCTFFPEGKHSNCCNLHDWDYIIGINRKVADRALFKCILNLGKDKNIFKKILYLIVAVVVYICVRMFGWYFWYKAKHERYAINPKEWWIKRWMKDMFKRLLTICKIK